MKTTDDEKPLNSYFKEDTISMMCIILLIQ